MAYNFIIDFCHKIIGCLDEKYVCRTDMRMSGHNSTVYDVSRREEEAYRCAKTLRIWLNKKRVRVAFGSGYNRVGSNNKEIVVFYADPELDKKLLAAVDELMEDVPTIDQVFKDRW